MRRSRRPTAIALSAAALAAGVAVAILALVGLLGAATGSADRPCSSYPAPGAPAPPSAKVPARLAAMYSMLRDPQRSVDRLKPSQIAPLKASGLIMSGTRFLGDAALGGRIYLVPAQHLLPLPLAPPRCLSSVQRLIEQESLPVLRSEYRQAAVCTLVLYRNTSTQSCDPANGTSYALLSAQGTPAFGLVPDGVSAVTVSYPSSPPSTVAVHRNFFVIVAPSQSAPACGVQWLEPTGNVKGTPSGCSYLTPQTHELYEYRGYVASRLSTLRSQITALSWAIDAGSLPRAQAAWLTAHLTWLEIGQDDGAYGAFGALGGQIDGLAAGHPRGTADPGFTGFHKIEFDLWTKHDLQAAAKDTANLQTLVAQLMKVPLSTYLPATATGIGNWLLRPHEVLEDALRDSLTADDDYGSGSDLASITADVTAERALLSELEPGLDLFAPHLVANATAGLDSLMETVDATRVHGAWISVQDLPAMQRQEVDADVGDLLETLAPIPDLLTSTGTNAPGD